MDDHEKKDQEIEAVREDSVTADNLEKAAHRNGSRICGDLSRLKNHIKNVENRQKHVKMCVVCGEMAYSVVSSVATKPCTFPLKNGSSPETTASWITTTRFFWA